MNLEQASFCPRSTASRIGTATLARSPCELFHACSACPGFGVRPESPTVINGDADKPLRFQTGEKNALLTRLAAPLTNVTHSRHRDESSYRYFDIETASSTAVQGYASLAADIGDEKAKNLFEKHPNARTASGVHGNRPFAMPAARLSTGNAWIVRPWFGEGFANGGLGDEWNRAHWSNERNGTWKWPGVGRRPWGFAGFGGDEPGLG